MILELAHITITPGKEEEFLRGVQEATPLFKRARGCRAMSLQRGIEKPEQFHLVVTWDTLEDHMVHFRESEDFQKWRALVGHCFAAPPMVEHVETVLTGF